MFIIDACKGQKIVIGRVGENEARAVRFDVKRIQEAFPGASFTVLNRRPCDADAYPVNGQYVSVEGHYLKWTLQSGDVAAKGNGECEIRAEVNGQIVKTEVYITYILYALDGSAEAPEPWESWVE